jgi:hypothetical protein
VMCLQVGQHTYIYLSIYQNKWITIYETYQNMIYKYCAELFWT